MAGDAVLDGVRCMLMRGGTSKGAFFLAEDVPDDPEERDVLLLRIMGTPDPRQVDGLGGAHPLTSKVAIVSRSEAAGVDVDYLFVQLGVDEAVVGTTQTCGNLLAGVGPFAVERGLVEAGASTTSLRIRMVNTGDIASATFATPDGRVDYDGDTSIDGVPGTAGRIGLEVGGGPERSLLPSGHVTDMIDGHEATLVSNGMPVVLLRASEFGVAGGETTEDLESRPELMEAVTSIRRQAGPLMGLGDVAEQTVPKMVLLSAPRAGGVISTRAFIPRRVHSSIGVLMAASVAAGIRLPGAVGSDLVDLAGLAELPDGGPDLIEHPSGVFPAQVSVSRNDHGQWHATSTSVRTARKIFDGRVFPRPRL